MDTFPHNDELLDLLYGECSPEEEARLREAIADDEELAEQWRQLQQVHGDVQRHIPPPEEVPDEVSAAILDAASQYRSNTTGSSKNRSTSPGDGLWTTFVDSGGFRIAASLAAVGFATILLYIYYGGHVIDDEAPPSGQMVTQGTFEEAEDDSYAMEHFAEEVAVSEDIEPHEPDEPAPVEADAEEVAETADSAALAMVEAVSEDEEASAPTAEPEPAAPGDDAPLAMLEERTEARQARPSLDSVGARGRAAGGGASAPSPQAQPESGGSVGGLDSDDFAMADDLAAGAAPAGPDREEPAAPAEADAEAPPADEAPTTALERALRAHREGDRDRARQHLEQVDEDQLDDDELEQYRELEKSLRQDD